jgi:hypothetical protein
VVEMELLEIITGHYPLDEISKYDVLNDLQMLYVGEERTERKKNGEKYCAARKVSLLDGETVRRERGVLFDDATAAKIILPGWWINGT